MVVEVEVCVSAAAGKQTEVSSVRPFIVSLGEPLYEASYFLF